MKLIATTAAAILIALAASADEPPCDGAESWARMVAMSVHGMKAMAVACAPDPAMEPCVAYNTALVSAPVKIEEGDSEKAGAFTDWLAAACPDVDAFRQ